MPEQSADLSSLQCFMVEGTPEAMTNRTLIASCGNGIMSASHRSGVTITYPPHDIDAVSA
jgi:hypothetical protein